MAFAKELAELATIASSITLFAGNTAKNFGAGLSGSFNTLSTQGSWNLFRNQISEGSVGLEKFKSPFQNQIIEGIDSHNWSQASLDIINHSLANKLMLSRT